MSNEQVVVEQSMRLDEDEWPGSSPLPSSLINSYEINGRIGLDPPNWDEMAPHLTTTGQDDERVWALRIRQRKREWHGYRLFVLPNESKQPLLLILRPIGYRRICSPLSSKSDSWDLIEEASLKARKEDEELMMRREEGKWRKGEGTD